MLSLYLSYFTDFNQHRSQQLFRGHFRVDVAPQVLLRDCRVVLVCLRAVFFFVFVLCVVVFVFSVVA